MQQNVTPMNFFEFYFPNSDTLIQVGTTDDNVTIRATRATFSDRRKECFIHELAAEGFIPDGYRWYATGGRGVRWILDRSWLKVDPEVAAQTRRWMMKLFISGGLLWVLSLSLLLFS